MRKYLLGLGAAAFILCLAAPAPAGSFDAKGQFVGPVSAEMTAVLRVFPGGGPGLRGAIARAVEADASLVDDVIFVARNANRKQREAIWAGLADAANYYARLGSSAARAIEQRFRTALETDNADAHAGPCLACADDLAAAIPGFRKSAAPAECVSPSRPGC